MDDSPWFNPQDEQLSKWQTFLDSIPQHEQLSRWYICGGNSSWSRYVAYCSSTYSSSRYIRTYVLCMITVPCTSYFKFVSYTRSLNQQRRNKSKIIKNGFSKLNQNREAIQTEIVATTLTWRDNTGPAVVAAVVPILLPGDFIIVHPDIFPSFLRMNSNGLIASATLTHKNIQNKMRTKRTERSMNLSANWRLAYSKSSMLQENNPDAACMYEIHAKDREREQC